MHKSGWKLSEEAKQKMRDAWKKRRLVPFSDETRRKMSNSRKESKNPNWQGGRIKHIVQKVKERDGFSCKECGFSQKEIMVVDHDTPRYIRPDLALFADNLRTLCPNCHAWKTIKDRKDIAKYKRMQEYALRTKRYQNSICRPGWLHKFRPMKQTKKGMLERCERCGQLLHCPLDMPNNIYVSYHVRDILREYEPMYRKEYAK